MSKFTRLRLWLGAASLLLGWLFWHPATLAKCCCAESQQVCGCQPSLCGCDLHPEEKAQAFLPFPLALDLGVAPLPAPVVQLYISSATSSARVTLPRPIPLELLPRGPPSARV